MQDRSPYPTEDNHLERPVEIDDEDEKQSLRELYAARVTRSRSTSTSQVSSGNVFTESDLEIEDHRVVDTIDEGAYLRHRPTLHLMPHTGWMNDPCGLGWDAKNQVYTVSVQWNPDSHEWARMSWCHATSTDLFNWTVSTRPSIEPTETEDVCGVFTGCLWDSCN